MITRANAIIPIANTADLSGKEGHFVDKDGNLAGETAPFGVVTEGYAAIGERNGNHSSVAVCAGGVAGTVAVKLAADASRGDFVGSDANSKADPAAAIKCAQLLEDGKAEELVEAVLFKAV